MLVATGRGPSLDGLGLDQVGVAIGANGGVTVDDGTRTSASHVWAAGDVTPDIMLANLAELEARQAVEDMYGLDPAPLVHEAQASIYFLSPEVAGVGLNEQMAKAKGIDYRAAYVSNKLNRRNIAMRATSASSSCSRAATAACSDFASSGRKPAPRSKASRCSSARATRSKPSSAACTLTRR